MTTNEKFAKQNNCLGQMASHSGFAPFSCGPNAYSQHCHWGQDGARGALGSEMWPSGRAKDVPTGLCCITVPPSCALPSFPLSNPLMAPQPLIAVSIAPALWKPLLSLFVLWTSSVLWELSNPTTWAHGAKWHCVYAPAWQLRVWRGHQMAEHCLQRTQPAPAPPQPQRKSFCCFQKSQSEKFRFWFDLVNYAHNDKHCSVVGCGLTLLAPPFQSSKVVES